MSETPRIAAGDTAVRPAPIDSKGRRLVEIVLVRAQEGAPVRIEAYPGERYEIRDPLTGRAPKVLRAWRVGRDLWIALDTQVPADASVARPDVVIGQYFDPAFVPLPDDTLVGLDEGGATRSYQVQVETLQGAPAHRVLSTLGLVSTELVSFGPEAAAAVPGYAWGAPLLGLLAAGGGGGGGSSGGGGGGGTPILGAPTLSGSELTDGLNRAEAADGTTLSVRLPAGAAAGDIVATTLTRPDGGTFTLTNTLTAADVATGEVTQAIAASALSQADGTWNVRSALSRGGVAGTAASLSFTLDTTPPGAPTVSVAEGAGGLTATEAADGTTAVVRLPSGSSAGDRLDLSFTPPGGTALTRSVTLTATDVSAGQVSVSLSASDLRPGGAVYADGAWSVRATLTDAAGNTGDAGTTAFTLETRLVLQGSVAAGLVTSGATVQVLGSSGEVLGAAQVQGDGTWQLPLSGLGGYRGPVIVKVLDANGAGTNYQDEVTAASRSLDTTLRAMSWVGDANPLFRVSADGAAILEVSVTPLTELATRKAIGFGDRPPADFATVDQYNRAIARAFGLTGELTATPVPTNSAAFNAADGLSSGEAIGLALAKLSGLDRLNGGRLADTLAQLEQSFIGSGATLALSPAGAALIDQGRQQALNALKSAPSSAEQTFLVDTALNRQALGEVVVTRQDVTEDGRLIVFGQALPGSKVQIRLPDGTLQSATAATDGSFVLTSAQPQPTFVVPLAVTGQDALQQPAAHTVPSSPTIDPGNGRVISGTGTPGSLVEIFDASGKSLGKAPVNDLGLWSLALATPLPADASLRALATDSSGNVSSTSRASVRIDQPGLSIPDASDGYVNAAERDDNGVAVVLSLPRNAQAGSRAELLLTRPDGSTIVQRSTLTAADIEAGAVTMNLSAASLAGNGRHGVSATVSTAGGTTSPAASSSFVVDTSAPAAPAVAAASDRAIQGTAEPGTTVVVRDAGGAVVGTAGPVAADGNWTVLPRTPLADGASLSATATDAAGNAGPAGTGKVQAGLVQITGGIDDAAPGLGLLAGGAATNDTSPLLTGSTGRVLQADQVLAVYRQSGSGTWVRLGTATVSGTSWTFQDGTGAAGSATAPLAAGSHAYQARIETAAGAVSGLAPSSEYDLTVVSGPPAAHQTVVTEARGSDTFISAAERLSGGGAPTVTTLPAGTRAGDTLTATLRQPDGVLRTFTVTLSATEVTAGAITQLLPQEVLDLDGTYELRTTLTSAVTGLSNAEVVNRFMLDTNAPAAPTGGLDAGSDSGVAGDLLTNVVRPVLKGAAEAGSAVQVSVRLQSGELAVYTLVASAQGVWSVDTASVKPDGSAQLMPALADGSRAVSVVARDESGNTSAAGEFALGIDTTVIAPVIAPSNGAVAVSGSGEPGALVTLTQGTSTLGSARVGADGSWRIVLLAPLADGTVLGATQVDAAGNASAPDSETVNARVPTLDPTNGRSLSGTGKAGDTIALSAGGVAVGTALVDAEGKWQLALGTPLANGTVVQATDQQNGLSDTRAVDALPPLAPAAQLDAASDSGLKGDGRTSDTTPTIVGSGATAGDTITVTMPDSGEVLRTRVAADGSWRVTPANALAHGTSADVLITATDAAGNTSAATKLALVIDTQCATPTVALDAASDSGAAGDRLTNVTRPVLKGVAEAGSTVQVVVALDASSSATFTVKADASTGAWSVDTASVRPDGRTLPMPALADGSHAVSVTATDLAGNTSASAGTLALVVDTSVQAPAIAPTNGLGAITGTGEAGAVLTLRSSSAALGTAVVAADGSWRIALGAALDDGTALSASQVDAAGNTSALAGQSVNANVPLIEPTNGRLISGTARAGNTVVLTAAGGATLGTVVAGADGRWSLTPASAPAHGTQLTATNQQSGLSSSQTVDAVAPGAPAAQLDAASDSGIKGDGRTNVATPTLSGAGAAAGDLITVTMPVSGEVLTTRVGASGAWSVKPATALPSGASGDALVTATDPAGNTSPATRVPLSIDTTAPAAPTGGLDAGSDTGVLGDRKTRNTTPVLSGAAEAGSQVELTLAGRTYTTTANAAGRWSIAVPGADALPDAVYRPVARSTDAAGNSTLAAVNDFEVDATPPAAAVTALDPASDTGRPGDNITRDTQPTIRGSGEAGATVVFTLNGKAYRPTPDASGSWTVKVAPADALVDATYTPQVSVTDAAGNTTLGAGGRFTVDTTAPVSPRGSLDARSDTGVLGDNRTSERTPTISGTAEPGSIMEVTIIGAGRTIVVATTTDANGAWSVGVGGTEPLANGSYTIGLKSTDGAGNSSTGVGTPFEVFGVILAKPVITQVDDDVGVTGRVEEGASTDDPTPTLRISGSSGSSVQVFDGATRLGTATETSTGIYTFTPAGPLAEGLHAFTARATDSAGNVSEASAAFRVMVDVSAPATPAILTNEATIVSGTATLGAGEQLSVRLGGATYAVTPTGNTWALDLLTATPASGSLNLAEAPFVVRAEAVDAAGNVSVAMSGTSRDDVLTLLAEDIQRLAAGTQTVQGADGLDTLAVASTSEPLDLTTIAESAIQGVERISLGRNTLKLASADVRALGGTELTVQGLSGGAVKLQGAGWTSAGDVVDAGITYTVFQSDGVSVRVQSGLDVTTNVSPLVLDLDGHGLQTLAWSVDRRFDLNGDGRAEAVAWIAPGEAFLALDRDGDGAITSGRELFGNATPGPNGQPAANGFEALRALDGNEDGVIDAHDEAWSALRLWRDANGDARSQPGEILSPEAAGVLRIELAQSDALPFWQHGNLVGEQGTFQHADGSTALMADIWLEAAVDTLRLEHVLDPAEPADPATAADAALPASVTKTAPQQQHAPVLTLEQLLGPGAVGSPTAPPAVAPTDPAPGWPGPRPMPWDDLLAHQVPVS